MNRGTHHDQGENVDWATPVEVVALVHEFFGGPPDLYPCSNSNSVVGAVTNFSLPSTDGLGASWNLLPEGSTKVYVNSPFGRYYVSQDRLTVYSAKEFSRGRKIYKEWVKSGLDTLCPEEAVSDMEAAGLTSFSISNWTKKCLFESTDSDVEVVQLLPAATDTANWQGIVFPAAAAICFIAGRLQFIGSVKGPAPMPCALVFWGSGNKVDRFEEVFGKIGTVLRLGGVR